MNRVLVDHLEWITANLELGVDGLFVCDGTRTGGSTSIRPFYAMLSPYLRLQADALSARSSDGTVSENR